MSSVPVEDFPRLPVSADSGPTILRILLGAQLRRLRTSAGITREAAGYAIRCSRTKIRRMELGQVSFKQRDVADLLTLYGIDDAAERDTFFALTAQANTRGWWHGFADLMPSWFEVYVALEEAASVIRCCEAQYVPGLLQSEDYAHAVMRLRHPLAGPEEIERRVSLQMNRTRLLHSSEPPKIWAVIDEAALRRQPGGSAVMKAQIEHLLNLCWLPHVTVQVAPLDGDAPAVAGPFTLLRFAEPALPDIVYLEQLTGAVYLDKADDLDAYTSVLDQLCVQALSPSETVKFLTEMADSL